MNFLDRFSKYTQISFFMKNLPVGVELFHAEGGRKDQHTHTHTTKLIVTCHNFANAPKISYFRTH